MTWKYSCLLKEIPIFIISFRQGINIEVCVYNCRESMWAVLKISDVYICDHRGCHENNLRKNRYDLLVSLEFRCDHLSSSDFDLKWSLEELNDIKGYYLSICNGQS